ncbi:MAG: DUF3291 domain-containing protein [Bacteroidia bacterium]|nr:DUF3291 domain-containing protein [Bacteroidia bacterium]MBT8309465.1 DUF3291 domain-containing protein [Bacteroidia bacterium]
MEYNIAQLNLARMIAPIDSPIMADFVNNLDRINNLAENSIGFVWRLKGEEENATTLRVFSDEFLIINMSVWDNLNSLFEFTYNTDHVGIMKRKKEWFSKMKEMHMVLWYIKEGDTPSPDEAKERLAYLREHGETPHAFSFKSRFTTDHLANYKVITS